MSEIRITFMRHGRSRADDEEVYEGRYDSPLTEVGREQIARRAAAWREAGVSFDRIVASTLTRAAESARIVGEALGVGVDDDPDWMERDNGPLAGVPFTESRARFPEIDFGGPFAGRVAVDGDAESEWDLQGRAARALQSVLRRGPGSYLVVAHGGILNSAMRCIVGPPPPARGSGIHFGFGDGGYVATMHDPDAGRWVILEVVTVHEG